MRSKLLDRVRNFAGLRKVHISQDAVESKTEDDERGHWTGKCSFLLACLGSAVGLGNVWRFPYLCYKNGGGAFLIPYVIMVFLVGIPVFLVEVTLGQYSALGPVNLFYNLSPVFKGLGLAIVITAASICTYYNMIIAWTLFYLFDSLRSAVNWQFCDHPFNTNNCFIDKDYRRCKEDNSSNVFLNRTCFNSTFAEHNNIVDIPVNNRVVPAQEYFNLNVLNKSPGIEEIGNVEWRLVLCLLAAWTIVVLALIKGIKTSGKVVYFTATFPYVILLVLFIQGMTLDGFKDGLRFYFVPDFSKLTKVTVWHQAAVQVFFSFSIGGGGMITYASYNRFKNNIIKDVLIIGIADMMTSIFSGMVVFSMLGFMAKQLGKSADDVVTQGPGLAFISYPEGISRMSGSGFWAVLFFFMLFLLGIDSQFALVETVLTAVFDLFPKTRNIKPYVVTVTGIVLFLLGLPLTTRGGNYVLELMDKYVSDWPFLIIGLFESLIAAYIYGMERFLSDIKTMANYRPNWWMRSNIIVCLGTISPILIGVLLIAGWMNHEPLKIDTYVFPNWANIIGYILAGIPIACIPIGMIHEVCRKRHKGSLRQRAKKWVTATEVWEANARANGSDQFSQTSDMVKMSSFNEGTSGGPPNTVSHLPNAVTTF